MNKSGGAECMAWTWGIAAVVGIFTAVVLWVLGGWSFMQGAFMGLVVFAILGVILMITMCRGSSAPVNHAAAATGAGAAAASAAAAPRPAPTPAPEPTPAPAPVVPGLSDLSVSANGQTGYTGSITADQSGGNLHVLASTGSTATAAAVVANGISQPVGNRGPQSFSGDGLEAGTNYFVHAVHRSGEGVDSAVMTSGGFSTDAAPAPAPEPEPTPAPAPAAEPEGVDYDGDGVVEGTGEGTRPAALDGPRGGKADDLKRIKGVGPKMEKLCNSLGFYHFDQIASWSRDEVAWVDANLEGFKGRVTRDTWVEQARLLASGGETEFSKKVDDGDVY
jgi:predicted flap endonuclease-1-like 5' DNA nuclease